MSLHSWLQNLRSALAPRWGQRQPRRRGFPRPATHRPGIELLEDRCVPAQYTVAPVYLHEIVGLNNVGQVAGNNNSAGGTHAFVWDNGTTIDLGTLGGSSSRAQSIDDLGQVFGWSDLPGDTVSHAFRVTPQGGLWFQDSNLDGRNDLMIDIGTLSYPNLPPLDPGPGYFGTTVAASNDAGESVGSYFVENGPFNATQTAFRWTPDAPNASTGSFEDLPVYYDTVSSFATDINNSGQIVGSVTGEGLEGGFLATAAVLWDNTGGLPVSLESQLVPGSYVHLEVANFINDRGAILAGSSGIFGQYLLTPVPPGTPVIRIAGTSVREGNSGTIAATFTVTLSAASTQTVTVAYATGDGSATAGSDFQATSGTLTFAPGQTSKTITVPVLGDRVPEATETFYVNLSHPTNATIANGQGVGTIVDDEPRVSISDVTKAEGKKNQTTLFTFTVTLSAAYDQAVTMSYQTVNGTATTSDNDYVAQTGTITFKPGEKTKTITIEVKGDSKKEASENFYLDLFGLSSNALFTKKRGVGTILDDD